MKHLFSKNYKERKFVRTKICLVTYCTFIVYAAMPDAIAEQLHPNAASNPAAIILIVLTMLISLYDYETELYIRIA